MENNLTRIGHPSQIPIYDPKTIRHWIIRVNIWRNNNSNHADEKLKGEILLVKQ
ncbi:hypothetical protein A3Q56_03095 [Intoshia linei]|uniref:Uncharacterized protein n=1 Tax=Intoshia linei TaxID=1819745 RepID=A0A177B626_9BILA|nr:hypothetical protein A3Q56_03095 [Intoshia linei]